jgi:predicted dehydrogenase
MKNTYHPIEVEDTVHLAMEFKSGSIHHFFASTDPRLPPQIETRMVFEQGRLFFNDYGCRWGKYKEPVSNRNSWSGNSLINRMKVRLCGLGSYRNILEDMEGFIVKGKSDLTSNLTTAVEVHRVIDDFYRQTR